MTTLRNWAGNHTYRAGHVDTPRSVGELLELVSSSPSVRVVGTGHTFTDIGDGERLVSLRDLGERFEVAPDRSSVTIDGAMTYTRLGELLADEGLALANLASLTDVSVAGAISTATHGSGSGNGNLATAVRGLVIAAPTGVHHLSVGDPAFADVVVSLGAFGAITEIELEVEPAYEIAQTVWTGFGWDELLDSLSAVFASAYSVSLFTDFGDQPGSLWTKRRTGEPVAHPLPGLVAATEDRHPIPGRPADACTPQGDRPGPWSEILPHFRSGQTPSIGAEIQSEYFVALEHGAEAVEALRKVRSQISDALQVSELRTVAGDGLSLSPQHEGATLAAHFTWGPDPAAALTAAGVVEAALAPFRPRPHWGKLFTDELDAAARYHALDRVRERREEFDPDRRFVTPWFERVVER